MSDRHVVGARGVVGSVKLECALRAFGGQCLLRQHFFLLTRNKFLQAVDAETPEAVLASKEIAQAVNEAMDGLPAELRQAITLREIDGLSYEAIAQALACPIGTVRSRIFRAREAISARIKPMLESQSGKRW